MTSPPSPEITEPPAPEDNPEDELEEEESAPSAEASPRFEWLTRSQALREAQERVHQRSADQQRALQRACLAEEGAERAINPVDPFRNGSGASLALSLYREALHWALLAQPEASTAADLPASWAAADRSLLERLVGGPVDAIEQNLVRAHFTRIADMPEADQRSLAWQARTLVGALIERAEGGEREVRRLRLQRLFNALLSIAALVGLLLIAGFGVQKLTAGPNLARDKPWRSSSAYRGFNATTHICDNNPTKILFHTNEEDKPWFEIDLGISQQIRVVEVTNRTDGFQERAVPLVIELSDDRQKWNEVARRDDTFNTWRAKFAPQGARYVRIRALRRTFLHLESVAVRSRLERPPGWPGARGRKRQARPAARRPDSLEARATSPIRGPARAAGGGCAGRSPAGCGAPRASAACCAAARSAPARAAGRRGSPRGSGTGTTSR